jgi:UDP-N-acetylmuramoylalanine--D-glutamate ligase
VHLILGGSSKAEDFGPLVAAIGPNVRSIHLIGAEAARLESALGGHRDETLERAVAHAAELAQPGDVVLLSPACASYDQFENFEQRGDTFRRLVLGLRAAS